MSAIEASDYLPPLVRGESVEVSAGVFVTPDNRVRSSRTSGSSSANVARWS